MSLPSRSPGERTRQIARFDPIIVGLARVIEATGEAMVFVDEEGREVAALIPPAMLDRLRTSRPA